MDEVALARWQGKLARLMDSATGPLDWFAALATVRADGTAANRMMVMRGFVEAAGTHLGVEVDGRCLCAVTDVRSDKVAEAVREPGRWAELCWYWIGAREQFRLSGPLVVLDAAAPGSGDLGELRPRLWQGLSPATRSMFAWPAPGQPLEALDTAATAATAAAAAAADAPAVTGARGHASESAAVEGDAVPATFAVVVLAPRRVDWLRLCEPGPHQREVETRQPDGTWQCRPLTP